MMKWLLLAVPLGISGSAALAAPAAATTSNDFRVTCENSVATGSSMVKRKTCRLASAWSKSIMDLRDDEDFTGEQPFPLDRKLRDGEVLQVGSANWEKMPDLKVNMKYVPYTQLVAIAEEIFRTKQCTLPGQTAKAFDLTVPYAALVEPNGKTQRVLVSGVGCTPIETLVGMTVLSLSERGDIRSTGEAKARWFDGTLNLTLKGGR
ncbi:hypothetical protein E2493_14175 [Sphingomonas parva]|uniref:Uncharacterized protein n=1 Tax=Sphingomonas parva TaxID=2555898 RepID=A0A4Y8ZRC3_9SPHN|nr:hypothetical protein [Sphingomonas parva]TFI57665.1 hypothetical protein E2493_14175 [Sphingomonas parva]